MIQLPLLRARSEALTPAHHQTRGATQALVPTRVRRSCRHLVGEAQVR